jgi:hypothetical protein
LLAFMTWLQASALGHVMRESGVWAYAVINLLHILSVAALFGSVLLLDLRLLGLWRAIPLASISRPAVPIAATGFVIAAITGLGLLASKATEYVNNPFIYIKFPAIFLALVNVAALSALPAWRQHRTSPIPASDQNKLAIYGGISLFCWLTAITAGRMIGYW